MVCNLLYEIREQFSRTEEMLSQFDYIPEVCNFLKRREEDLKVFENIVSGYYQTVDVLSIIPDIRERGYSSKYYGGICLKGADYFKPSKKVIKLVNEEIEKIRAMEETDAPECDEDYAILDED